MPIEQPHKKTKKIQPVYLAFAARKLKEGLSKKKIAELLQLKGASFNITRLKLSRIFPKAEIKRLMEEENKSFDEAIDILLWRYRYSLGNKDDRSASIKKLKKYHHVYLAFAAHKLKQGFKKIEISKLLHAKGVPFGTAKGYLSVYFPKAEINRLMEEENKSFDEAIDILLWRYRESVKSRAYKSETARKIWTKRSPEERTANAKKGWVGKTPEERTASAKKGWARKTPEERSAIARKREAAKTPEERSAIARKIAESSRKTRENRFLKVSYVADLPILNLVPEKEQVSLFQEYMKTIWNNYTINEDAKLRVRPLRYFSRRNDFEDIKSEYQLAILEALAKWDPKSGSKRLNKLVTDTLIYKLTKHFKYLNEYYYRLSGMDVATAQKVNEQRRRGIVSKKKNRW